MLRSFVVVAETLNISKSVESLGLTRQTIRRHLDELEQLLGVQLFETSDRQYHITPAGKQYLGGAINLIEQVEQWANDEPKRRRGLETVSHREADDGFFYFSQQHPLVSIWEQGVPLLKAGLQCWTQSGAAIEHSVIEQIRPYLLMFRKNRDRWLCTFVGERSSYASWLGLTWAKSAVGSGLDDDAANPKDSRYVARAYEETSSCGSPRYDHVYGSFSREEGGELVPVSFQRLICPCTLPDGEPMIAVLVARTNCISIDAVDPAQVVPTPENDLMEFDV